MASEFRVRRARLSDAAAIAQFVNTAQSGGPSAPEVTRSIVVERFGQIGFCLSSVSVESGHRFGDQQTEVFLREG